MHSFFVLAFLFLHLNQWQEWLTASFARSVKLAEEARSGSSCSEGSLVQVRQGEPNKIRFRKKADFCLYYSLFIIHHSLFIYSKRILNE